MKETIGPAGKYIQTQENRKYHMESVITAEWIKSFFLGKSLGEQDERYGAIY
jgi:hypothetical protein